MCYSTVVSFDGVSFKYDDNFVLRRVSFDIKAGEFKYVYGDSGAGKTTLLKLAYRDLRPYEGDIVLLDKHSSTYNNNRLPYLRRKIGLVLQGFSLLDHLTTIENVALPLYISGYRLNTVRKNVEELISWVGLSHRSHYYPAMLSEGEKQRVAIARAVIMKPRLLIADEPTASVDNKMARRIMYLFKELNKMGTAILMATHSHELMVEFPSTKLHLCNGTVKQITDSKC